MKKVVVQKKSVSQLASVMSHRFDYMLMSLDEAIVMSGLKTQQMKMFEDSEQFEARRELLPVEQIASQQRAEQESQLMSAMQQLEASFHDELFKTLGNQLNNIEKVFTDTVNFHPAISDLLDVLYSNACNISKLESYIEPIQWLKVSVMKFVRQPKYQRTDANGNAIIISSLKGSLSFIGIESLQLLLPALIVKKTLPAKSDAFPNITQHLWQYSLGTAKTAHVLAEKPESKIAWYYGYVIGMLSMLGRSTLTKMYLKEFDNLLRKQVIEARKKNNPSLAKKIVELRPSTKYLHVLWKTQADNLTLLLITHLNCKRLKIGVGIEDYLKIKHISASHVDSLNLNPLAFLLYQSQGYMRHKMLRDNGLLSKKASLLFLRNFNIKADDAIALSKVNLNGLEIKIAEFS